MRIGRYDVLEEIGRGGMARVLLARQLDLDRLIALKELGLLQREDVDTVARFLRESRVAGALNHPNIVTVHDFFEHEGVPYIAMEFLPRGSLRPWVPRLTTAQVGGVLEGVLAGLGHAHAAGVVHRDLKPENLMVSDDGRIKIADFGIAKLLADSGSVKTATGMTIGTPSYMAPEQASGGEVGPWTDLYATGVVAYELLARQRPFGPGEPLSVALAHVNTPPPSLLERAPEVPEPLAEWVHGLLAKDPSERPSSAGAASDDLEDRLIAALGPLWHRAARLEGGTPAGPVRDPGTQADIETAAAPKRPRRALLAAAATLALAGAAVALALGGGGNDREQPAPTPAPITFGDFASAPQPLGPDWLRAVHIWTYQPDGHASPAYAEAVRAAAQDGASHVVVHVMVTPVAPDAPALEPKPGSPPPASTTAALDTIRAARLKAIIQPIVDVPDGFSGTYAPRDLDAFFAGYRDLLLPLAAMAPDVFVVGSLLDRIDGDTEAERWRRLADQVRDRCRCRVTYIADDIDEARDIRFWDAVDLIGMGRFAAVTAEPTLDPDAIAQGWDAPRRELAALAEQYGKPAWLGEAGYTSRADASSTSLFEAGGPASEDAQAALFEGVFRAFHGLPWFEGVGWFEMSGDGAPARPRDYLFAGKTAQQVLRAWQTATE